MDSADAAHGVVTGDAGCGQGALVSSRFTFAVMLTSTRRRGWVEARRSALFLTNVVLAGAIIAISAFLRSLR